MEKIIVGYGDSHPYYGFPMNEHDVEQWHLLEEEKQDRINHDEKQESGTCVILDNCKNPAKWRLEGHFTSHGGPYNSCDNCRKYAFVANPNWIPIGK